MFTFVAPSMYGYLPPSYNIRAPNTKYPSSYLPYSASGGGGKDCGILEDRSANMSKIPKRGYKVLIYKGGRFTILHVDGGRSAIKKSYICDLPILNDLRYDIEKTIAVYISIFI